MADINDDLKKPAVEPTTEKENDELSELEAEGVAGGVSSAEDALDANGACANYKC